MNEKMSKFTEIWIYGTIVNLIATIIVFTADFISGKPLESGQKLLLFWIGTALLSLILGFFFWNIVKKYIYESIRSDLERELENAIKGKVYEEIRLEEKSELELQTGIIKIYPNFNTCENEVLDLIKNANSARIFIQIGKSVLGGTTNFYDHLGKVIQPETEVKILHASIDSPYLSETVAKTRKSDYKEWIDDLEYALRKVYTLRKHKTNIESRQHKESFTWRLFIIDEIAFIEPYYYLRNNSQKSPVLKVAKRFHFSKELIGKDNPHSLYKAFLNYFDSKWNENQPQVTTLSLLVTSNDIPVVAAVVKYAQFYIFAIPARYIRSDVKELPFHGIGGKLREGERWLDAIKREVREETGQDVEIESASRTRYYTTQAEMMPIDVADLPRPYCIYKRTKDADPNFVHPEVQWLIGYRGKLNISGLDELSPKGEIAALVCLTGDMLIKTLYGQLTYDEIQKSTDGSRVIPAKGVDISGKIKIVPTGLATIVAVEEKPRISRKL